jgi:hypothetical protein
VDLDSLRRLDSGRRTYRDQEARLVDISRGPELPEEAPEYDRGRDRPV